MAPAIKNQQSDRPRGRDPRRNDGCSCYRLLCSLISFGALGFLAYAYFVDPSLIGIIQDAIGVGGTSAPTMRPSQSPTATMYPTATFYPSKAPTTASPTAVECSPGCSQSMLNNTMCDAVCFNDDCNLDEGDCEDVETGTQFLRTIYLGNHTSIPDNVHTAVKFAIDRWNAIIKTQVTGAGTEAKFQDFDISTGQANRDFYLEKCFPNNPVANIAMENLRGLVVSLQLVNIDGAGGVLGSASVCTIASSATRGGLLNFDLADLESLAAQNQLEDVLLHEIGHTLGLGTLWGSFGLRTAAINPSGYNGTAALAAYKALDVGFSSKTEVPLEQEGGEGTAFAHWENLEAAGGLCKELMTGTIDSTTVDAPVSAVTIQALVDLGHTVDAASEGVLPTLAELCAGSGSRASSSDARGSTVDLSGDVQPMDSVFDLMTGTMIEVIDDNARRLAAKRHLQTSMAAQNELLVSNSGLRGRVDEE